MATNAAPACRNGPTGVVAEKRPTGRTIARRRRTARPISHGRAGHAMSLVSIRSLMLVPNCPTAFVAAGPVPVTPVVSGMSEA